MANGIDLLKSRFAQKTSISPAQRALKALTTFGTVLSTGKEPVQDTSEQDLFNRLVKIKQLEDAQRASEIASETRTDTKARRPRVFQSLEEIPSAPEGLERSGITPVTGGFTTQFKRPTKGLSLFGGSDFAPDVNAALDQLDQSQVPVETNIPPEQTGGGIFQGIKDLFGRLRRTKTPAIGDTQPEQELVQEPVETQQIAQESPRTTVKLTKEALTDDQINKATQLGAIGFDEDLGKFVDAQGQPIEV